MSAAPARAAAGRGLRGRPARRGRRGGERRAACAERARGLAASSAGSGSIALRVARAKRGGLGGGLGGVAAAAGGGAGAELEEALDDAVLERVEGDDGEPAARRERTLGGGEAAGELAELVVDRDAQRLEAAGRGVRLAGLRARQQALDQAGELQRGGEGRAPPVGDDGAGDAAGRALLAVLVEEVGERGFGQAVDEVGGRWGRPGSSACRAGRPSGRRSRGRPGRAASRRRRRRAPRRRAPDGPASAAMRSSVPKVPARRSRRPAKSPAQAAARASASGSRSTPITRVAPASSSARA